MEVLTEFLRYDSQSLNMFAKIQSVGGIELCYQCLSYIYIYIYNIYICIYIFIYMYI